MTVTRMPSTMLAQAGSTRAGSGYERYFRGALDQLHGERRYRVFADIERISGRFPTAKWRQPENQAGISTIDKLIPDCLILSDAFNHNSMIEGVRHSGCAKKIFRHNDLQHLEELLREAGDRPKLIVFESVYSMDGDVAPIGEICDLADRYGAMTYLDAVRSFAPGFIFTTALPPAVAAAARASVRYLKRSGAEREAHQRQAAATKAALRAAGLPVLETETHIVPVMVGDAELCKAAADHLLEHHAIYIQPINYPTVPRGTERLRITPSPFHDAAHIERLAAALTETWEALDLPRAGTVFVEAAE